MRQNEFLFINTAISTRFWAICSKMKCVLVLNGVRFGTKCKAFWCKTQGKMLQNAVRFAAKCETIEHKNTLQCINKTLSSHETHGSHLDFLNLYTLRGVYYLCTVKNQDKHSSHVRSTGQRYNTI